MGISAHQSVSSSLVWASGRLLGWQSLLLSPLGSHSLGNLGSVCVCGLWALPEHQCASLSEHRAPSRPLEENTASHVLTSASPDAFRIRCFLPDSQSASSLLEAASLNHKAMQISAFISDDQVFYWAIVHFSPESSKRQRKVNNPLLSDTCINSSSLPPAE